jgi:glycosyltransferase involved in cell wall biosynthesis
MTDAALSVVIATRDRPELLRRAIEAVLAQAHPCPIEVVLVFDHSEPDHSLARGATGDDRRVVVTTNSHKPGLAGARNSGVASSSHDWIAFCDDDDEWLPGKLAGQFAALDCLPGARIATTGVYINFNGQDTARIPVRERLTFEGFLKDRMTEVHPSATLVHRSVIDEIGDVDVSIPGGYAEDYDWLLRATKVSPIAVAADPLVRVYWHGASFFFERWKTIDEALEYLVEKHPEFHDHPAGLARILGQQAVARAAMGQRTNALRTAFETFRLRPLERRVPVAVLVAAGVPAGVVLKTLHRFGKGI